MNLLGWDGQTPLHLAACSSEIEQQMDDWIEKNVIDEEVGRRSLGDSNILVLEFDSTHLAKKQTHSYQRRR